LGRLQLELLKWWQRTEERLKIEETIDAYKREVQISARAIFIPDLYDRIFTPGYVGPEDVDEINGGGVFFPATDEEFDAMLEEWEDGGFEDLDLSGVFTQR
jgi:hypothetical protein